MSANKTHKQINAAVAEMLNLAAGDFSEAIIGAGDTGLDPKHWKSLAAHIKANPEIGNRVFAYHKPRSADYEKHMYGVYVGSRNLIEVSHMPPYVMELIEQHNKLLMAMPKGLCLPLQQALSMIGYDLDERALEDWRSVLANPRRSVSKICINKADLIYIK